jgi:hypothetical protein
MQNTPLCMQNTPNATGQSWLMGRSEPNEAISVKSTGFMNRIENSGNNYGRQE